MRLITRADLDGLACAAIITTHEKIRETILVHPQEITDKTFPVKPGDIIANLPYHPACTKWFDHHLQTESNTKPPEKFEGRYGHAASAAYLAWDYYGRDKRFSQLIAETNRLDSANLNTDDVLDPKGYILLGYTLDSRTGLGSYKEYFLDCLEWILEMPIDEVLEQPDVWMRCDTIKKQDAEFRRALLATSRMEGNVVVTDLRSYATLPIGNRFLIYVLYPQANVSLRIHWGPRRETVIAAVGHSIFNRTCNTRVGELMSKYGGGGHRGAGTAPLPLATAEGDLEEILLTLRRNG